jgi:hypothetical protein
MIAQVSRAELLKKLNALFSEAQIRQTARIINRLPASAQFGDLSIALGIVPREGHAQWRKNAAHVPVMIADAFVQGIRAHMRAINRTKGARYADRKAIRLRIVDGKMSAVAISQDMDGLKIKLTIRNQPFHKSAPQQTA